jgi:hypothetical protein
MGIWKRKGDPSPRDPVVLINDPSYGQSSGGCEPNPAYRPPWSGQLTVDVEIEADSKLPRVGGDAFVMCHDGGLPSVWVNDPIPRRVGHLIGPSAQVVADFVRLVHSGLAGTLALREEGAPAGTAQVRIPGPNGGR